MLRTFRVRCTGRAVCAGSAAALLVHILLALLLSAALVAAVLLRSGKLRHVARVADGEVGVLVDHRTGSARGIERTGYQVVLPGLQAVHKLTRSPIEYVMRGEERAGPSEVPRLVVRARDGARFWFDRVSIQYAVDAARPEVALLDSGAGDGFREGLVDAFARSVLQDELGRFTAADIVLPENRRTAAERAQERLAALLAERGVVVLEISLSRPRFEERYEQLIERRKVAEQEIERLEREAELMSAGKEQEERHFERKLELQLEKSHDNWRRELEQLQHAARTLEAGRAERLAQLERARELSLEVARAGWTRSTTAGEVQLASLESTRGPRLAAVRDRKAREGAEARQERERRRDGLERALVALEAERAARLEAARAEGELARAEAEAQIAAELEDARRDALRRVAAAEAQAAEREQLGLLEGAAGKERAAELLRRHAQEAEAFGALARALEGMGETGVRAALVQALAGVELELGPPPIEEERPRGASTARSR